MPHRTRRNHFISAATVSVALGLSIVILGNVSHAQGVATIGVLECL